MTSRFSQSWLQFAEYLLLMAACCSCMLPSITCQTCHYVPQYIPSPPKNPKSTPKALKVSSAKIIAIGVPCVVVLLIICGVGGCLWYWRSRRTGETNDREIPTVVFTSSDSVERTSLEVEVTSSEATAVLLQEKTESPYDIIDSPAPPIPVHAQESEKVQLLGSGTDLLSGAFRVDLSTRTFQKTRKLPPTPIEETPPSRPPKPTKKENTAPQIVCSCMLQARKQTPRLKKSDTLKSKDSGYDSTESSDSLSVDQEIALGGESCVNETVEGWEIDLERLEVLEEVLGEGEFGIVKKGRYRGEDEKIFDVAVKQLKDTSSMTDKADMLSEITILKQAGRHCNIVNLVGACTQKDKFLVVTELIPNGSLENFLKTKRIEHSLSEWNKYENVHFGLNDRQSLIIALQIASGMRHLEEKKCIHRDLAARNVFIDENNVAKVGDFGMARDISDDGIYTKTSSGKVPWRWLSLESLKDRVYTSRSDVWSFGIVLWEIATYGEEPYPDISSPAELITRLSSGFRMPRPDYCSDELYELMSSCWMENPLKRPTFVGITNQLKYYLREFKRRYENIEDDGICSDTEAR